MQNGITASVVKAYGMNEVRYIVTVGQQTHSAIYSSTQASCAGVELTDCARANSGCDLYVGVRFQKKKRSNCKSERRTKTTVGVVDDRCVRSM